MVNVFGQGTPGDMEGDTFTNQFSIPKLPRELKADVLENANEETERLDANVLAAALIEDIRTLVEELKADISRQHASKEAPQGTEHSLTASSADDGCFQLRAAESQQAESRQTSQRNRSPWDGPDDPKFKAFVEEQRKRLAYHSELAELFGVTRACKEISDGHLSVILADMVASMSKGRESVFNSVVRDVVADFFVANDLLPGRHYMRVVRFWSNLLCAGLAEEFGRRTEQSETASGRETAELIVEEDEDKRAELLKTLGNKVNKRLWFPGEYPGQSEEGPALAREKVWESVSNLVAIEPPAANPEVLLAFMRGALNKVLESARDHVRARMETEHRRSRRMVFADHVFPTRKWEEETDPEPLTAQLPGEVRGDPDWVLLVEQRRSKGQLTDRERKLIEFVKVKGHTQKEAAAKFGISQSTISKCLCKMRKKS